MAGRIDAKKNAQIVFQIAQERNEVDSWRADLNAIAATVMEPQVVTLLADAKLQLSEKIKLVDSRLGKINPEALNLVHLLIEQGQVSIIELVLAEYERLADAYQAQDISSLILGVEQVEATTAIPLGKEDRERLSQRLASTWGKPVRLSSRVDPSLVGGIVIKIGDRVIDGSVRGKLLVLRKSLIEMAS